MSDNLVPAAATPEVDHLITVRDEGKTHYLPEEQAHTFHHTVAKIMFMSDRARRDIPTTVELLTTQGKKPGEEKLVKLKRVLIYFKGMRELKLTVCVHDMTVAKRWVDTFYAAHEYFWFHTESMLYLGKGAVYSFSTEKLNGNISTEGELIGVDDAMAKIP